MPKMFKKQVQKWMNQFRVFAKNNLIQMKRTDTIDLLRGFIMIFMALDHASAMVGRVHFSEMWGVDFKGYPDLSWWFTRFISHLCAPGFFFLMGMSIYLFAKKRKEAKWSDKDIYIYFLKRGGIILLFMLFLEFPAWLLGMSFSQVQDSGGAMPGNYSGGFLIPTTVLYGLGMCMIIGGFLWKLKHWQFLMISVLSFLASGLYISNSIPTEAFNPIEHFLIVPGMSSGAMTIYPIIPWLGVATFGMFMAELLTRKKEKFYNISLMIGFSFLAIFTLLRFLEVCNFQIHTYDDWISFFTLIKYPPSLNFILVTCGINLIILFIFSKINHHKWLKPVLVFGQTAMFFYIAHLYLYAIISIAFPLGADIEIMYLFWILGLLILYFICNRFLEFKKSKPLDSIWRMI